MELNIFCYNIHSGKNLFYRYTLDQMTKFLQESRANILFLQEVQNNDKNGRQFEQLKQSLNMEGYFGGNVKIANGSYGNAILTRFPLFSSQNILLPSQGEQRGALHAQLEIQGRKVHLINTHLGLGKKERAIQLNALNQLILRLQEPILLAGDFNTVHPALSHRVTDLGKKAGKDRHPTIFPLKKRIDFIFASHHFELFSYEVLPVTFSDHYPVKAILNLFQ